MKYRIVLKTQEDDKIVKEYELYDKTLIWDVKLPDLILSENQDIYINECLYETNCFRVAMSYFDGVNRSEENYIDLNDKKFSFGIQTNVSKETFVEDADEQYLECQKIINWLNEEVLTDIRRRIR